MCCCSDKDVIKEINDARTKKAPCEITPGQSPPEPALAKDARPQLFQTVRLARN